MEFGIDQWPESVLDIEVTCLGIDRLHFYSEYPNALRQLYAALQRVFQQRRAQSLTLDRLVNRESCQQRARNWMLGKLLPHIGW